MTKNKEVTRIGGIAIPCDGGCHIVLPKSWQGFRVFCIRKDDYDRMKREEEKATVKAVGKLTSAIIEGASVSQLRKPTPQRGEREIMVVDNILSSIPTPVMTR